jgi:LPPG:FO 2-phospho-L-lactate transferase
MGEDTATMAPGVDTAISSADIIVVCPSNPWVSIGPILRVHGIYEMLKKKSCVAVSPIVGGAAIKGPAAKMYMELGVTPSALAVAEQYKEWVTGFVMDEKDYQLKDQVQNLGMITMVTNTIMNTTEDRKELAIKIVEFCGCMVGSPVK